MKLPEIQHPTYEVKLLSQKEPVKFRPFLVKEQKILMMAKESEELASIVKSLKQIARNCIVSEGVDPEQLPMVDLEWLFMNLRARSMGEVIDVYYKCTNEISEGNTCGMIMENQVNLLEVPIINRDFNSRIALSDTMGMQLRLPTFEAIVTNDTLPEEERDNAMVAACLEYIYDAEPVYQAKDATAEELLNFIEQLTADKYEKIEKFFENLPRIEYKISRPCPKCNFQHDFTLEGLEDFFL